ncbi:hypothetical protein [Streptomyces europaeiscabiei]|uniref:hypothetical protein n=1 Tax=Streptomyces europaeiscabiei TaxID=146819 RepID=UPI0029CA092A|nr:hypothetical protein [Streptomyces europaeiscabiei]
MHHHLVRALLQNCLATHPVLHPRLQLALRKLRAPEREHSSRVLLGRRALAPRAPGPTSDTGRGLALVEACAENWGWFNSIHTAEPHRTDGKFVWCEPTATV